MRRPRRRRSGATPRACSQQLRSHTDLPLAPQLHCASYPLPVVDVPSSAPARSYAFTATYGPAEERMRIVVSKPRAGLLATARRRPALAPASTRQEATSVAPFQLADTTIAAPPAPANASEGRLNGRPRQRARNVV